MARILALAMVGNLLTALAVFANAGPPPVPEGRKVVEPRLRLEGVDKHADYVFHVYFNVLYVGSSLVEVKDANPIELPLKWKDRLPRVTDARLLAMERKEFERRKKDDSSLKWLTAETESVLSAKLTPPETTVPKTLKEPPVTTYRIAIKDGKLSADKVAPTKSDVKEPTGQLPLWAFGIAVSLSFSWLGIWFARRRI